MRRAASRTCGGTCLGSSTWPSTQSMYTGPSRWRKALIVSASLALLSKVQGQMNAAGLGQQVMMQQQQGEACRGGGCSTAAPNRVGACSRGAFGACELSEASLKPTVLMQIRRKSLIAPWNEDWGKIAASRTCFRNDGHSHLFHIGKARDTTPVQQRDHDPLHHSLT